MKTLRTSAGTLEFSGGEPWLMATVTAGPGAVQEAFAAVRAGARIIGMREAGASPELIRRLGGELSVPLAVFADGAPSAEAGLTAGAAIVDATGGIDAPEVAALCARHGAGLVVPLGTPAAATGALPDGALMHGTVAGGDVGAAAAGDRPLLLHAESPELPYELAAVARAIKLGASVLAVYDVAAAADFLAVQAVLQGRREIDPGLRLPPELRREPADAEGVGAPAGIEHPPS